MYPQRRSISEWGLSLDQFHHEAAEAPYVEFGVVARSLDHFGSDEARSPCHARRVSGLGFRGQSQICYLDLA